MPLEVLEREEPLAALHRAAGVVVLVVGEAGIGKTSVVRAFAEQTRARVVLTACDDLRAPRTLGPLRDALGDGDPFSALMEQLAAGTVVAIEDVHWADDATLDVLAYAARRIGTVDGVLVLTFRDEEQQSLQRLLGVVATAPHVRIVLAPLSRAAVDALAGGDGAALHKATGGNPFFVTEVLAAPGGVPASVTDAVLARVGRLSPACRVALDQLSVVPSAISADWLDLAALTEAEAAGVILDTPAGLRFRHEIARRAVEQSLPALKRRLLNANVLRALRTARPDLGRLMHHAAEAGDLDAILEYGPRAAAEAAAAGSHRQALAHFETLLPHVDRLDPRVRAEVMDGYAWELYNAHRLREAVSAGREAADGFAALHDDVAVGRALVRLSRHLFLLGETAEAE